MEGEGIPFLDFIAKVPLVLRRLRGESDIVALTKASASLVKFSIVSFDGVDQRPDRERIQVRGIVDVAKVGNSRMPCY